MGVVRNHEQPVFGDRNTAVGSAASFAEQSRSARRAERPDLPARGGVECISLVRAGEVHDTVHDDRGDLQPGRPGNRENPGRGQALHVGGTDLFERTIAVSGVAAIVAGPVLFGIGRPLRVRAAATRQQVELAIGGQDCGAERGGTGEGAVKCATILKLQGGGSRLEGSTAATASRPRAWADRT